MNKIVYEEMLVLGGEVDELCEKNSDITNCVDMIDEASTASGVITEIVDVVNETDQPKEDIVQLADIAIESICRTLGMDNKSKALYSMESYNNNKTFNKKLALEDLSDKIRNIWEAIKKFVKSTWEKISVFLTNLLNSTDSIIKQFDNLLKVANERKDWIAKESETTWPLALMNSLGCDEDGIENSINFHIKSTETINELVNFAINGMTELNSAINTGKLDDSKLSGSLEKIQSNLTKLGKVKFADSDEENNIVTIGPMALGTIIVAEVNPLKGHIKISTSRVETIKEDFKHESSDGETVLYQVTKAYKGITGLMKETDKLKTNIPLIRKMTEAMMKMSDIAIDASKHIADATGNNNHEIRDIIEKSRKTSTSLYGGINKLVTTLPMMNIYMAKNIIRFLQIPLDNLKPVK